MTLLGRPLLVTLGLIAVVLPVLGVLAWQRCRGPRAVRLIQRFGIVLSCQLAALLFVAAGANDYGYFFSSWGQLRGIVGQALSPGSQHFTVHARHVATDPAPASAGTVRVLSDVGSTAASRWPTYGRIESVTIVGASSGLRSHAFVYLPPQYFQPAYAHARFPAAEVMTGYPGDDVALVRRLRYPDLQARLVRQHRARPMVLVMLRPSITFPRDTECTDVPTGPQALTFFASDLPAQVAHVYRVRAIGWGAMGDSTGGYCAAKIAMTHPLVFRAGVALSGYYFATHNPTTGDLWNGSTVVRHLNDLKWRLLHMPPPPVSLLITTSVSEGGADGYAEALAFDRLVRPPLRVQMLVAPQGGHNFATWRRVMPAAMMWLSARIAGAP